jgi:hypothetical protein
MVRIPNNLNFLTKKLVSLLRKGDLKQGLGVIRNPLVYIFTNLLFGAAALPPAYRLEIGVMGYRFIMAAEWSVA